MWVLICRVFRHQALAHKCLGSACHQATSLLLTMAARLRMVLLCFTQKSTLPRIVRTTPVSFAMLRSLGPLPSVAMPRPVIVSLGTEKGSIKSRSTEPLCGAWRHEDSLLTAWKRAGSNLATNSPSPCLGFEHLFQTSRFLFPRSCARPKP